MSFRDRFENRSTAKRRQQNIIADASPFVLCENLESRFLLSVSSWVVTWIGATPTSATLRPGQDPATVEVFLNTNTTQTPNHLFSNQAGQDLILLGSLSNFTVIDKVPAALKPPRDTINPGAKTEKGIKVQGGGGGATLVVDLSGRDG